MKIVEIKVVGNTLIVELDNLRTYSFEVHAVQDHNHLKQLLEDCLTAEKGSEEANTTKLQSCRNNLLDTDVFPK